jgi:hypothetical protein
LLARHSRSGRSAYVEAGRSRDANPDLRITGLRIATEARPRCVMPLGGGPELKQDPSPLVRRQCALSLRSSQTSEAAALWAELAVQHDGEDRW